MHRSASTSAGSVQIKERDEVVGNQTRVKVVKNKLAPPFRQVEFDIMYGEGVSKTGELLDLGRQGGDRGEIRCMVLLRQSAPWAGPGKFQAVPRRKIRDIANAIESDDPCRMPG